MGAPCVLRRRGWLKKCFAHALPPDFRAKNSTGRSPIFCLAFVGPFSFPNSVFSSQLHPFRTLKVQWGTLVFLRRRVGSRSVRYRWIFVLKHHRTLAIFGGCFRRLCQRPHRAFGSRSVPGTGTPAIFWGGAFCPGPEKSQRGAPPKSCHRCHCCHFVRVFKDTPRATACNIGGPLSEGSVSVGPLL